MSANMVAVLYLLSALLFIFALRGLSHPESSRLGNIFGIVGNIGVVLYSINIFGDFIVTYRMLSMFKKKPKKEKKD